VGSGPGGGEQQAEQIPARCAAAASGGRCGGGPRPPQHPYLTATAAEIHAALLTVTDPDELHRLVLAICSRRDLLHHVVRDPVYGYRQRLTFYVSAARERCTPSTRRNP
jgi:hypothetical protein